MIRVGRCPICRVVAVTAGVKCCVNRAGWFVFCMAAGTGARYIIVIHFDDGFPAGRCMAGIAGGGAFYVGGYIPAFCGEAIVAAIAGVCDIAVIKSGGRFPRFGAVAISAASVSGVVCCGSDIDMTG